MPQLRLQAEAVSYLPDHYSNKNRCVEKLETSTWTIILFLIIGLPLPLAIFYLIFQNLALTLIATVAFITGVLALYKRRINRMSRAMKLVLCDGSLKTPLPVVPGYVKSYHFSEFKRAIFKTDRLMKGYTVFEFNPAGSAIRTTKLDWSHSRGYVVAAGKDWLYLWLPAYRILDPCCRDVYIAAINPSTLPFKEPVQLSLSTPEGDVATAGLLWKGAVADAELEFWPTAARSSRLELLVETPTGFLARNSIKRVLITSDRGKARQEIYLGGKPGLYILSGVVRHSMARRMGVEPNNLAGYGEGARYVVRLVIDRPRRSDVHTESPI